MHSVVAFERNITDPHNNASHTQNVNIVCYVLITYQRDKDLGSYSALFYCSLGQIAGDGGGLSHWRGGSLLKTRPVMVRCQNGSGMAEEQLKPYPCCQNGPYPQQLNCMMHVNFAQFFLLFSYQLHGNLLHKYEIFNMKYLLLCNLA